MSSRNVALPRFPNPPAQYDQKYFSDFVRAFATYQQQVQNAGEGRATSMVMTDVPTSTANLEDGTLWNNGGFAMFAPDTGTYPIAGNLTVTGNITATGNVGSASYSLGGTALTPTAVEYNYLSGVTSGIQSQLDTKAPIASPTFTGSVTIPAGTINATTIGATTAAAGTFTTLAATTALTAPSLTSNAGLTLSATGANAVTIRTNGVTRMTLDGNGSVAIGPTVAGVGGLTSSPSLQVGNLWMTANSPYTFGEIAFNSYYDATTADRAISDGWSSIYSMFAGQHRFSSTAASSTAGSLITYTERFRIAPTGALGLSGANYGTAGQTIISAGSASPTVWGYPDQLSTATGTAPSYSARAWVQFTTNTGVPAIVLDGNVTSITDFAVGQFGVNFTVAMPDANYNVHGNFAQNATATSFGYVGTYPASTTQARVGTYTTAFVDPLSASITVFR